ncbi:MAG: purine phosphoribosyltransferase family protein, partial [Chloroflexota bacterium]|nr:purine phosphoribosyltransferase family protein [Chloroflexota bacterium]
MELKDYIRDVPDFPEPGILFKDITPMLANPQAFGLAIDSLEGLFKDVYFDAIVAVESRGFLFGAPLADRLKKPIIPVRKPGKLPA